MLELTIKEAKDKNINRVLLGAYTGNVGSWKVMEKCGGKFDNVVIEEETGLSVKRYWISLKKRYADRHVGNKANKTILKSISVEDDFFKGDIYFYNFIDVKDKILIPNGKCIMDNNYKWLEFYDYSSRIKLTAIYDENNEIIEWYFDIAREIGKDNVDEDELKEALERKEMTKDEYDEAYKIAYDLMGKLKNNKDKLQEYTDKYLSDFLKG